MALAASHAGKRVLLVSTDPAHSTSDIFERPIGPEPVPLLPNLHGLEILKRLRARGSQLPVLVLTAADSVEERVKGLDYGADDYMAKPFSLQELEARVRALTRRGMGATSNSIKHGPLVYHQAGRVATILLRATVTHSLRFRAGWHGRRPGAARRRSRAA